MNILNAWVWRLMILKLKNNVYTKIPQVGLYLFLVGLLSAIYFGYSYLNNPSSIGNLKFQLSLIQFFIMLSNTGILIILAFKLQLFKSLLTTK